MSRLDGYEYGHGRARKRGVHEWLMIALLMIRVRDSLMCEWDLYTVIFIAK